MFRQIISSFILLITTISILGGGGLSAGAKSFSDVNENHPNFSAIDYLSNAGVVSGYDDGTFKPDAYVNRAELTTLVVKAVNKAQLTGGNCFNDVKEEWFAAYVCFAKKMDIVSGFASGNFKPDDTATRAEALKIIVGSIFFEHPNYFEHKIQDLPIPSDVDENSWYFTFFATAYSNDALDMAHVSKNPFKYYPEKTILRKEVAQTLYKLISEREKEGIYYAVEKEMQEIFGKDLGGKEYTVMFQKFTTMESEVSVVFINEKGEPINFSLVKEDGQWMILGPA